MVNQRVSSGSTAFSRIRLLDLKFFFTSSIYFVWLLTKKEINYAIAIIISTVMMITIMILLVTTIIIIIKNTDDKTMNTSIIMLPFQSPKISIEIPSLSHSIECIMLLTTVLLNNYNSIQIHLNPFT